MEPKHIHNEPEHARKIAEARRKLPQVTPEQFGALHLFAHHYDVLGVLLADFTAQEIADLISSGYQAECTQAKTNKEGSYGR